jgi:hypothetical protein
LLPGPSGSGRSAAAALARACADLGLDFCFVPSWAEWAPRAVDELWRAGVAPLWVVPGVVWPSLEVLGVEAGLRASVQRPALLLEAMDAALAGALRAARAGLEAGAHGVVVADDMAGASGPLLSAAFLEEQAFPRLSRVAQLAREAGVPALLHCDGDARALFAAVAAAGLVALHGDLGGPDGIGATMTAARVAGIVLIGGVPSASLSTLAAGALAGTLDATLAEGGGLLVSDDGGVASREQVAALFAALGAAARA